MKQKSMPPARDRKPVSVRTKVMIPVAAILIMQLLVLGACIFGSGLLPELDHSAVTVLSERVTGRTHDLERDMLSHWSNLDAARTTLNKMYDTLVQDGSIAPDTLAQTPEQYNLYLETAADALISAMRMNATTGAFVVLNTKPLGQTAEQEENFPVLYLRDFDPVSGYSEEGGDLLLEYAPTQVVSTLGISTDTPWRPLLKVEQGEAYPEFFAPVFRAAQEQNFLEAKDLSRWSMPYLLSEKRPDEYAIAYTMPLISADGTVYGVMGIEILLSQLKKQIPYTEMGNDSQGAYVLGRSTLLEGGNREVTIAACTGGSYTVTLKPGSKLLLKPGDKNSVLFSVHNTTHPGELLAFEKQLTLYNTNTPFSDETWVLLGTMPAETLFALTTKLTMTFAITVLTLLVTSCVGLALIVGVVSTPIVQLAQDVRTSKKTQPITLLKTNIAEVDALADAVETLSNDLYHSARKFSDIIEMSSQNIGGFEVNADDGSLFINDGFFAVFGRPEVQAAGMTLEEFEQACHGMENYLVQDKSTAWEEENEYLFRIPQRGNDTTLWVRLRITHRDALFTGLAEDVSREQRTLENMAYERDHDVLTGLYNRRAFNRVMMEILAKPQESLGVGALLMMDLDNLKYVNDTYGHDTGDLYICTAAQTLLEHAHEHAVLARMSGDEFIMFFYGYATRADLEQELAQLQVDFRTATMCLPSNSRYPMRASGGMAWYPADSEDYQLLKRYADFAMYKVKHSTKGEFASFNLMSYKRESYLLENKEALNELVEQRLVDYHFQPIVDARTGEIFAYEALMRSRMEALGSPDVILRLAKQESKLGQIERLTWFCALDSFASNCKLGNIPESCKLFINSIPNQILSKADIELLEQRFAPYLTRVVEEHTEEEEMDPSMQRRKADHLNRWGGQSALDDFGSGYNSDKVLLSYTPDYIKIDRVLISNIDGNANKQQIVRGILVHARSRGIRVIGEGVETYAEMKLLIEMGVDYLQGYYLGRPALLPPFVTAECVEEIRAVSGVQS